MNEPFFVDYLERLEDLQRGFHSAVQDLPAAAMDWVPGPETNSAAVLLAHTAGSLRFWIGDAVLNESSGRVRAAEFETRGVSGSEMLRRLDEVITYARAALPRLSLADLEKPASVRQDNQPVTCGWALLHALDHGFLHLGHIQLTSQLWREQGQ